MLRLERQANLERLLDSSESEAEGFKAIVRFIDYLIRATEAARAAEEIEEAARVEPYLESTEELEEETVADA